MAAGRNLHRHKVLILGPGKVGSLYGSVPQGAVQIGCICDWVNDPSTIGTYRGESGSRRLDLS
jgi:hypothetical protein